MDHAKERQRGNNFNAKCEKNVSGAGGALKIFWYLKITIQMEEFKLI